MQVLEHDMKYSPKVNEAICRSASVLDVHPLQNPRSLQGILKILFDFGEIMCEISGMNKYSFQGSSGAQGIYTNACLIRAYHESKEREISVMRLLQLLFSSC
ncbi:MAG: hypothetical protein CM1200mP8_3910 [Chloroflexota bacterium]|nr:MAG: hypothetical protein CM1200mP8_3910 [Chloroflexota bacterium]